MGAEFLCRAAKRSSLALAVRAAARCASRSRSFLTPRRLVRPASSPSPRSFGSLSQRNEWFRNASFDAACAVGDCAVLTSLLAFVRPAFARGWPAAPLRRRRSSPGRKLRAGLAPPRIASARVPSRFVRTSALHERVGPLLSLQRFPGRLRVGRMGKCCLAALAPRSVGAVPGEGRERHLLIARRLRQPALRSGTAFSVLCGCLWRGGGGRLPRQPSVMCVRFRGWLHVQRLVSRAGRRPDGLALALTMAGRSQRALCSSHHISKIRHFVQAPADPLVRKVSMRRPLRTTRTVLPSWPTTPSGSGSWKPSAEITSTTMTTSAKLRFW